MTENIFEYASRHRLRFPFRGEISCEDLWELSFENLDSIYRVLSQEQQRQESPTLLSKRNSKSEIIEVKLAIIRHVFETLKEERLLREKESLKAARRRKILDAIAQKEGEALMDKSVEELVKMAQDLEK